MIGIIDYGAGNLLSVKKALAYLGADCKIVHKKNDFNGVDKLILPGVGAFQSAIDQLKRRGLYKIIKKWLACNTPFLGICLGMQVLFECSEESQDGRGFGVFPGKVLHFKKLKVPQIGWNQVAITKNSKIMSNIRNKSFFYFLHSYFVRPDDNDITVGTTDYGLTYASVVARDNIYAVQFHPEKSGATGLQLLKNWVELC
jgi:glutamine amidotransferase